MAFLTTLLVPQETTDMMNGFGFHQTTAISPMVHWNNLKGIDITHDHHEYPRNIDDVFKMIYCTGFNDGVNQQAKKYQHAASDLLEKVLNEHRVMYKVSHRADNNFKLPLCVE